MERVVYPYREPLSKVLMFLLASAAGTGYAVYTAMTHATIFYGVVAVSGGFFLISLLHLYGYIKGAQHVALDDEGVEVPRGVINRRQEKIPFSSVTKVYVRGSTRAPMVIIHRSAGAAAFIVGSWLPSLADADQLVRVIRERITPEVV